ncbi:HPr family phosphocarrier protein [Bacillus sp. FJAT-50079]|uniref:HPr family phosphocarrier protein n=1 Tax=Bacillus sp. FJAT-50079 TaxID=2833577 RepID=UPI001BCA1745|nr:HPr family phosphocarrier protein [Bacillus sp. FJAT-50079]MBS4206865.1 HPr family phosphocarrier protein [Bacillus sp. FJAT-50079]
MIIQDIWVNSEYGIHLRSASELVEIVKHGSSKVCLIYKGKKTCITNIISVLKLGVTKGSIVTLIVDGVDAEIIMNKIKKCITD